MNCPKLFVTVAVVTLLVSACSKDEGSPAAIHTDFLPVAVVETYAAPGVAAWQDSSRYSYDAGNRLAKVVSLTAPGSKLMYRYDGPGRYGHDDFSKGSWSESENYWINESQRVDSSFHYNAANDSVTGKYLYNAANQRIEKYEYQMVAGVRKTVDRISYSYNRFGDVQTEEGSGGSISYTYVKDRLNSLSLGLVYQPSSIYLVHSSTIVKGDGALTFTHHYRLDGNEHVMADTTTGTDGSTDIKTYYY